MTLNVSVLIEADASGARRGFKETRDEMGATGDAARKLGADAKTAAAGVDAAAEASRRAAEATRAQGEAERVAAGEHQRVIRSIREMREALAGLAAARAQAAQAQLNQRLGVRDDFGSAGRAADVAAYGQALDEMRARYVPLVAIEMRRRQVIGEIQAAERAGALTAGESAEAIDRVTVSMNAQADAARTLRAAIADTMIQQERAARQAMPNSAFQVDRRLGVRDDFGSADRGADVAAFSQARDDLRAKLDPVFAQQRAYVANLREIREAQRLGVLSSDQMAAALSREKAAYAARVREQKEVAAGGLPAYRRANLFSQYLDIGTSLAGGMNPALIAAQQGPQIVEAYGGVKPTLDAIAKAATPVRLAIGGIAAVALTGAAAWNRYLTSTKAVETVLEGVGRGSGATARQVEEIASSAARQGEVSVSTARDLAAQLLATGKIGAESLSPSIAMIRDFAATVRKDIPEAGKLLSDVLADPGRGVETLRSLNLIDAATASYVRRLAEQNRLEEARGRILDALPGRLAKADQATSALGRAWERLSTSVNQAFDDWGRAIDRAVSGPGLEERLAQINRVLEAQNNWPSMQSPRARASTEALKRERDDIQRQIDAQKAEADKARRDRDGDAAIDAARDIVGRSPVGELTRRRDQLRREIGELDRAKNSNRPRDADPEKDAEKRREEAAALEAKKNALAGVNRELERQASGTSRQAELDRLDLQIMQARDPIAKAELESKRARIEAEEREQTTTQAAAAARDAYNRSLGQSLAASSSAVSDMREETAARARANDAVAAGLAPLSSLEDAIRQQIQLKPLLIAYDKAEGDQKRELGLIIQGLRGAYAAEAQERARSQALQAIGGQRDELERLKAELGLVTATNAARERELALLEANQRIREIFGSAASTNPLAQQMRDNAVAIADARAELERTKAAWDDVKGVGGRAIDEMTQKIADGSGSWKDLLTGTLTDIKRQVATWAIANPLKNQLFGENLPTMQDAGGVIGRLFGGQGKTETAAAAALARSTQLMTVSATTVVVNGGVQGVGAGLAAVTPNSRVAGAFEPFTQPRPGGVPSFSAPGAFQGLFATSDAKTGYPGLAAAIAKIESSNNPNARNPSGAAGLFQFMPKTAAGYGLSNPYDAAASTDAFTRLALDNKAFLSSRLGREPTAGELYLAHQQGAGGAFKLLDNPGANAAQLVGASHVTQNGGNLNQTGGEFAAMWTSKLDGAGRSVDAFAASAQRADTGVAGFGTALDQTAKTVAQGATGVGGAAKDLASTTAQIPNQTQGFFQTALGALGQGLDGLFSALGGGGGGGGIGGFFSSLIGGLSGGGASAPAAAPAMARASAPASAAAIAPSRAAERVTAAALTGPRYDNDRGRIGAAAPGGISSIKIINPTGVSQKVSETRERQTSEGGRELQLVLAEIISEDIGTSGSSTQAALGGTFGLSKIAKVRGM